ncbi:MAG: NUDIX domain-containing protein [Candidatus Micrarchaeia archaeon]
MAETRCEGGRLYYDCPSRSCFKVNANAIVRNKEGKLLLIRVGKGYYEGYWSLPGGKVAGGESLFDAAEREVEEEAGIRARAEKLVCLGELIGNPCHMFVAIISAKPLEG